MTKLLALLVLSSPPQTASEDVANKIEQSIACSVYALVAATHVPAESLKVQWREKSISWSISANQFGASEHDHALMSEKTFEQFEELTEGERLAAASYHYRNGGCS
ncbi:conserved hypothetical protein [Vibrio crassostreae]|nr:conserved hypothetical protein [Vibrio chagasii]CAK1879951.1 conserved hypothetical protein [Vibrio crassostreae]CAK1885442.1 conserved hypothetical protein [Vibrio crassostreae]CAK2317920.1 conserved hypothetical protein [Vibrio crassostreae]CAK2603220.1 conserved hypothetical protein [Vibrio crassostreae]